MARRLYYGSSYWTILPRISVQTVSLSRAEEAPQADRRIVRLAFDLPGATWKTDLGSLVTAFSTNGYDLDVYEGVKGGGGTLQIALLPSAGVLMTGQPFVTAKPLAPADIQGAQIADAFGATGVIVELIADYVRGTPTYNAAGMVTTSDRLAEDGLYIRTVSGNYRGTQAASAADAQKLSGAAYMRLSEEQTVDAAAGTVSFHYSYAVIAGSRSTLEFRDSITYAPLQTAYVVNALAGGGFGSFHEVGQAVGSCDQSGEAVGMESYPSPPADALSDSSTCKQVLDVFGKTGPRYNADGSFRGYGVSWSRRWLFTSNPGMPTPATS